MCDEIVNEICFGLSETIYQNSLKVLFRKYKINYQEEVVCPVYFQKEYVGFNRIDLIVQENIIIEMKTISKITDKEINQLKRYMKLRNSNEGYLINISQNELTILRY